MKINIQKFSFLILFLLFVAISAFAQSENDYWKLGNEQFDKKNYEAAIKSYTECIRLNPNTKDCYGGRAQVYTNLALQMFQIAGKTKDENDVKQVSILFNASIKDHTKDIELNPNLTLPLISRATVYIQFASFPEALADLAEVIRRNPRETHAYLLRGHQYILMEKYDLAVTDFTKTIEIDPRFKEGYSGRSIAYCQQGNRTAAQADERKAVEFGGTIRNPCR